LNPLTADSAAVRELTIAKLLVAATAAAFTGMGGFLFHPIFVACFGGAVALISIRHAWINGVIALRERRAERLMNRLQPDPTGLAQRLLTLMPKPRPILDLLDDAAKEDVPYDLFSRSVAGVLNGNNGRAENPREAAKLSALLSDVMNAADRVRRERGISDEQWMKILPAAFQIAAAESGFASTRALAFHVEREDLTGESNVLADLRTTMQRTSAMETRMDIVSETMTADQLERALRREGIDTVNMAFHGSEESAEMIDGGRLDDARLLERIQSADARISGVSVLTAHVDRWNESINIIPAVGRALSDLFDALTAMRTTATNA
jgi:hypothetical protein